MTAVVLLSAALSALPRVPTGPGSVLSLYGEKVSGKVGLCRRTPGASSIPRREGRSCAVSLKAVQP